MTLHEPSLPLAGVRILDLTVVWAGPYAAMQLADWGAEVIRIESTRHFTAYTRGITPWPPQQQALLRALDYSYPDLDPGVRPWNRAAVFNAHGRNKLSMTLDLTRPEGQEVFERLVRISDGLIENNVPVNMEKLGVTWERLSVVNPRLVMVRMPAFGLDGPYKNYRVFGSHVEALTGHTMLRAYPNTDLTRVAIGVPSDAASGIGGAMAFLMGVRYRRKTGQGVLIEVPMAENFVPFLGYFIMDYSMNAQLHQQLGNEHLALAPHNVYPCRGEDRWIAIACRDDEEWRALCGALGRPDLADDERFREREARWAHRHELDSLLADLTGQEDAFELVRKLQAVGVPAGAVMNERDALEDPHLRARGFFQALDHPETGTYDYVGPLFRSAKIDNRLRRHAPRLGEDNDYVYKELLGFSQEEYERFVELGHIGTDYDASTV